MPASLFAFKTVNAPCGPAPNTRRTMTTGHHSLAERSLTLLNIHQLPGILIGLHLQVVFFIQFELNQR